MKENEELISRACAVCGALYKIHPAHRDDNRIIYAYCIPCSTANYKRHRREVEELERMYNV